MLIAHVTFQTAPQDRAMALDVLMAQAATVRAMAGNRKFQPCANPERADTLEITHEWETAADFAAYLGSDNFSAVGAELGPKMTAPPVSNRFHATPVTE